MARRAWLLLLSLLPIGCAPPPPAAEADALAVMLASNHASIAALTPAALRPPPVEAAQTTRTDAAGPPGSRPASAAQLMGAVPEALRRWLGEPSLRRREGNAEIWLYAGAECALDLVLYREGGALKVAHAAARASGTATPTEGACLRQLAGAAAARPVPAAAAPNPATPREPGV